MPLEQVAAPEHDTGGSEREPVIRSRRPVNGASVLRRTGKTLMTVGLLILGFVVHQLWFTNVLAAWAQGPLEDQLAQRSEVVAVRVETVQQPATALEVPAIIATPLEDLDDPVIRPLDDPEPPEVQPPGFTGDSATDFDMLVEPAPEVGDAFGRLVIPAAGVDWVFVEGVSRDALKKGPGHMPGTALPGRFGNTVISGHRTTYGAPFYHLDRLEPGDLITIETSVGLHTYEVVESVIVAPSDIWVTQQWQGSWLTLTTCHPRFSASERLVVFSRLVDGPNAGVILGRAGFGGS